MAFPNSGMGGDFKFRFFAKKGYHVIVPDQRGYNLSSKPKDVKDYKVENAVHDVVDLIKKITAEKVFLVGHDWGGVVGWALAMEFPDLIKKLIIINVPHPSVAHSFILKNPVQLIRSSYIGFFQIPWLPEKIISLFNFKLLEASLTNSSIPGTFTKNDLQKYKEAWKQSSAITSMINWYRGYKYSKMNRSRDIEVPVLVIWGKKDPFLSYKMATLSGERCHSGNVRIIKDATHWVHHEKPDQINELIDDFIRRDH